jgi:hypothetical protein
MQIVLDTQELRLLYLKGKELKVIELDAGVNVIDTDDGVKLKDGIYNFYCNIAELRRGE